MLDRNQIELLSCELPDALVAKARMCDRLRFAASIVPWKYADVVDECDDGPWLIANQERMAQAVESIRIALASAEQEYQSMLVEVFRPRVAIEFHDSRITGPSWLPAFFCEFCYAEGSYVIDGIRAMQSSGKKFVYEKPELCSYCTKPVQSMS